ncbi:hypothetical protein CJ030_MR5G022561 [Morella rubra]|uniref:Uncharacterized protein n=1 Tax=Morella rubra TaxID=262757 RepID=A0A6A1VII9_9ROSI|nr:hypothetical protein CJ030_MR5G022561 [Morella rubra]
MGHIADFNDFVLEDRLLREIIGAQGCIAHLQRTGAASMDMVREFDAALLLVPNISDNVWEVTIRNIRVLFLREELARFLGIEGPMIFFPTVELRSSQLQLMEKEKPTIVRVMLQPTHQVLGDISAWLATLEAKAQAQDSHLQSAI